MSAGDRGRCPVCKQTVFPSMRKNVGEHYDSIRRDRCPGSGEPWLIADRWFPAKRKGVAA